MLWSTHIISACVLLQREGSRQTVTPVKWRGDKWLGINLWCTLLTLIILSILHSQLHCEHCDVWRAYIPLSKFYWSAHTHTEVEFSVFIRPIWTVNQRYLAVWPSRPYKFHQYQPPTHMYRTVHTHIHTNTYPSTVFQIYFYRDQLDIGLQWCNFCCSL